MDHGKNTPAGLRSSHGLRVIAVMGAGLALGPGTMACRTEGPRAADSLGVAGPVDLVRIPDIDPAAAPALTPGPGGLRLDAAVWIRDAAPIGPSPIVDAAPIADAGADLDAGVAPRPDAGIADAGTGPDAAR